MGRYLQPATGNGHRLALRAVGKEWGHGVPGTQMSRNIAGVGGGGGEWDRRRPAPPHSRHQEARLEVGALPGHHSLAKGTPGAAVSQGLLPALRALAADPASPTPPGVVLATACPHGARAASPGTPPTPAFVTEPSRNKSAVRRLGLPSTPTSLPAAGPPCGSRCPPLAHIPMARRPSLLRLYLSSRCLSPPGRIARVTGFLSISHERVSALKGRSCSEWSSVPGTKAVPGH